MRRTMGNARAASRASKRSACRPTAGAASFRPRPWRMHRSCASVASRVLGDRAPRPLTAPRAARRHRVNEALTVCLAFSAIATDPVRNQRVIRCGIVLAALTFAAALYRQRLRAGGEAHLHHRQQCRRLRRRPLPRHRRDLRRRGRDRLLPVARLRPGRPPSARSTATRSPARFRPATGCTAAPATSSSPSSARAERSAAGRPSIARRACGPRAVAHPPIFGHLPALRVAAANAPWPHCARGARTDDNSSPVQRHRRSTAGASRRRAAAQARRLPAAPAQRAVEPGLAGADPGLRPLRYRHT